MQTRILGTTMPVLEVELDPNESVFSESGELSWMTASIQMTTHTQMGGGGGNPDTILSPATAKNVITVGALEQLRYITNIVTDLNSNHVTLNLSMHKQRCYQNNRKNKSKFFHAGRIKLLFR